jgi:hypothetical protein
MNTWRMPPKKAPFPQKVSKYDAKTRPLDLLFSPGPFDVICGRGKEVWNHSGNVFFRKLVEKGSVRYGDVKTKVERTKVVSDILETIRTKGSGFVKEVRSDRTTKQWIGVSDVLAREKVGQLLRNSLSHRKRSSTTAKSCRRREVSCKLLTIGQQVLESNREVRHIMHIVSREAYQSSLSDEQLLMVFTEANQCMLDSFKKDKSLVARFQYAVSSVLTADSDDDASSHEEPLIHSQ